MNRPIPDHDSVLGQKALSTPSVRAALAGLSLCMLLSSLGTSIANVALPTLGRAFEASFQAVQWVVLAYLLAITCSIVGAGRLGDLMGRRRLLALGILSFTAASLVAGSAPSLWLLVAARAAQGLGAAVMMALTMAFVGEIVPQARTGSAMGLLGTTSAIGTALGPSLGGLLIHWLGWRAIFLINVPLGVGALLLAQRTLPADRATIQARQAGFDPVGTLLLALTLAAYALAVTLGRGHFGVRNVALLLAALVGAALFLVAEVKASSPLIRMSMFRDPALSASLGANLLVSTVLMSTLVVGPFYLSRALGHDAGLVGIVMSMGPLVAALTGVPAGRAVDRFGTQRMTLVGLGGIVVGCCALALTPETLGIPGTSRPASSSRPLTRCFRRPTTRRSCGRSARTSGESSPGRSTCRATSDSSRVPPSWALCLRSPRVRATSRAHRPTPSPPACASPSPWRPP